MDNNKKKLICIIDVQNDFIDGALRNEEAIKVIPKMEEYLNENLSNAFIICTFDTHDENYMNTQEGHYLPIPHCIKNTEGHQLNSRIADVVKKYYKEGRAGHPIRKGTFGANPKDWQDAIESLKAWNDFNGEIEFIGFCTDICVVSNALMVKALYPELKISVLKDLCAGVTEEKHNAALAVMQSCQIEVK